VVAGWLQVCVDCAQRLRRVRLELSRKALRRGTVCANGQLSLVSTLAVSSRWTSRGSARSTRTGVEKHALSAKHRAATDRMPRRLKRRAG
jgi:hypothetical protein